MSALYDPDNPPTQPATPMTAHKAWYGALAGALVGVLGVLSGALDDGLTGAEIVDLLVAAVIGSGITGGVVYRIPNKPKSGAHARTTD